MLCHLEQLLLVTHLDLSHNRLRALPPALAALRCLEVKLFTPPSVSGVVLFPFLYLRSLPTLQRDAQVLPATAYDPCLPPFVTQPDPRSPPMHCKMVPLGTPVACISLRLPAACLPCLPYPPCSSGTTGQQ